MKIRFLTRVSSSIHGSHKPGDVFDWKDDKDAARLVAAGIAEKVTPTRKTKVEKATASKTVETATSD